MKNETKKNKDKEGNKKNREEEEEEGRRIEKKGEVKWRGKGDEEDNKQDSHLPSSPASPATSCSGR